MLTVDFVAWLDKQTATNVVWYVKRLALNDTLASGSNQAGPYVPKHLVLKLFPWFRDRGPTNPDAWFDFHIDSHVAVHARQIRAVYYNRAKDEARLTNFGGISSPLLDPESTGSIVLFAFRKDESSETLSCSSWLCSTEEEEDIVEDRLGPIEPGKFRIWSFGEGETLASSERLAKCWLSPQQIPEAWRSQFPSGEEIVRKTVRMRPKHTDIDERLLGRRECEYEMFLSIESYFELPTIQAGFNSIGEFVARAQTILQRRKARSGRSLELHARELFIEEGLLEGVDFSHQPESDPGHKPDFLFPSRDAYRDAEFPVDRLRMLAVKTTCKDRWRQILTEAKRIPLKHLLTLQEGVSESQFREMTQAGVQLVVPERLRKEYPKSVRPQLQSVAEFVSEVRMLTR